MKLINVWIYIEKIDVSYILTISLFSSIMDILNVFFPNVLSNIIFEYTKNIGHKFEKKLNFNSSLCEYATNTNDYRYVYDYNNIYTVIIKPPFLINTSRKMQFYKNYIFVLYSNFIEVFNIDCVKILTRYSEKIYKDICVIEDKCFASYKNSFVDIFDANNMFDNPIKCVKIDKNDQPIYKMNKYDNYIYLLSYNENIFKCSCNGDIIESYMYSEYCKSTIIYDFCVIDNVIYFSEYCHYGIYKFVDNKLFRVGIDLGPPRSKYNLYFINNILYIHNGSIVQTYNVSLKN